MFRFTYIMAGFVLAVFLVTSSFLQAQTSHRTTSAASDPKVFIEDLGNQVVKILEQKNLTKNKLRQQFNILLSKSFNMPTIGRFVLGPYWNQATSTQQQEYMTLFQNMIVDLYANRFINYSGERFQIIGSRPEGPRDILVDSEIIQAQGKPVAVSWRVRKDNSGMKIVDVIVEGVSMGATQRADFSSVIQQRGGIEGLLSVLRERIARLNN